MTTEVTFLGLELDIEERRAIDGVPPRILRKARTLSMRELLTRNDTEPCYRISEYEYNPIGIYRRIS